MFHLLRNLFVLLGVIRPRTNFFMPPFIIVINRDRD
jgi:hypothetical protein